MIKMHVEATYGDSRPLSELTRLMHLRCQIMHETSRDAAIATVINAANALRAQTKKAKASARAKPKIAMRDELVASFYTAAGHRRRCLRNRQGQRISLDLKQVWLSDDSRTGDLHVYHVRPENSRMKAYLAIATKQADVKKYETARCKRRKAALGGLAKFTLGRAMAKLSTKGNPESAGPVAVAVSRKYAHASASAAGHQMNVELASTLDYAVKALKGGRASVDLALKRAANKTFGFLSHQMSKWGKVENIGECPFPEIVGRRKV